MCIGLASAAVFNLDQPAHYVHWHFFDMSVANVSVVIAMLVVFALAIVIPFPGARRRAAQRSTASSGAGRSGG